MPGTAVVTAFGALTTASTANLDTNFTNVNALLASANNYSNYLVDSGAVNAYVVSFGAGITLSLAAGLGVQFKTTNTNTLASTLNVSATGVKSIVRRDGSATLAGDIQGIVTVMYDGTNYVLLSSYFPATVSAAPITNSLSGDVTVNNVANYFDGPSIAQGVTGTWWVSGTVTVVDTSGSANWSAKLWDGSTVVASAQMTQTTANFPEPITLSGYLASPAGNLRISVKDTSSTSGLVKFNSSGNSKDSTISAFRIA